MHSVSLIMVLLHRNVQSLSFWYFEIRGFIAYCEVQKIGNINQIRLLFIYLYLYIWVCTCRVQCTPITRKYS